MKRAKRDKKLKGEEWGEGGKLKREEKEGKGIKS